MLDHELLHVAREIGRLLSERGAEPGQRAEHEHEDQDREQRRRQPGASAELAREPACSGWMRKAMNSAHAIGAKNGESTRYSR